MSELKPCPFCGCNLDLHIISRGSILNEVSGAPMAVYCAGPDCEDVWGPTKRGEYSAIAAWNTRADLADLADTIMTAGEIERNDRIVWNRAIDEAAGIDAIEQCMNDVFSEGGSLRYASEYVSENTLALKKPKSEGN